MATVALVDCNSFYVSAERVFRPDLDGRPVVVLSNNDGCAIARSPEAKALGVAMGAPAYTLAPLVGRAGLVMLSSNYALYGDMSARVMSVLDAHAPAIEIYSIDEAFLDLGRLDSAEREEWCRTLRATVRQWTGIPVSIGVGPTKTLAKLANRTAKTRTEGDGVFDLGADPDRRAALLRLTAVGEVWGIGRQSAKACAEAGIRTAWDLTQAPDGWLRRRFGVVGLRTALELRGTPVHRLEPRLEPRQSCCCSRSFGSATAAFDDVRDALVGFAARAAEKVRHDGLRAGAVHVFLMTDRFRKDQPQRSVATTLPLPAPTAMTPEIIAAALAGLRSIWAEGYRYRKAGLVLLDLAESAAVPADLFAPPPEVDARRARLMAAVDESNRRFGRDAVQFGLARPQAPWRMRQSRRSPGYTTRWDEIVVARLG